MDDIIIQNKVVNQKVVIVDFIDYLNIKMNDPQHLSIDNDFVDVVVVIKVHRILVQV